MTERYSLAPIQQIWSEENKFSLWLALEYFAAESWADEALFDKSLLLQPIKAPTLGEIYAEELKTKHEFQAFLNALSNKNPENELVTRWFHYGLTSSDIIDTTYSFQLTVTCLEISKRLRKLNLALSDIVINHAKTKISGRTHGQTAEVTSLGNLFAGYFSLLRTFEVEELPKAINSVSIINMSGPIGNYSVVLPVIGEFIKCKLQEQIEKYYNVSPEQSIIFDIPLTTQVIPRIYYADYFIMCAKLMSLLEMIATEIRLRQQSGIEEFSELFSTNQVGSSSMPHKKNPILSENIIGLSRIVRSAVNPALENISLWNQRDMTHSSVERVLTPQVSNIVCFALERMTQILNSLNFNEEQMFKNIESGKVDSHEKLCSLIKNGHNRKDAYDIVYKGLSFGKKVDDS
jgi:adenylosuccinate lyase